MHRGFIKVYRSIQENDIWFSEPFTRSQAWIDLLILANHKDTFYYKRGIKIEVKRGQLGRSQKELADRWKWSRGKVDRFLNELETVQQIEQQKNKVVTIITLINYDKYNNKQTSNDTTDGHQIEQQTDIYKNDIEDLRMINNEKEIKTMGSYGNHKFINKEITLYRSKTDWCNWVDTRLDRPKELKTNIKKLISVIPKEDMKDLMSVLVRVDNIIEENKPELTMLEKLELEAKEKENK